MRKQACIDWKGFLPYLCAKINLIHKQENVHIQKFGTEMAIRPELAIWCNDKPQCVEMKNKITRQPCGRFLAKAFSVYTKIFSIWKYIRYELSLNHIYSIIYEHTTQKKSGVYYQCLNISNINTKLVLPVSQNFSNSSLIIEPIYLKMINDELEKFWERGNTNFVFMLEIFKHW